jgi:hypothetical protein
VENGSNTGGVLSINKGKTTLATLNLSGVYTSANFNLSADAFGGTLITDPPAWPGNSGNSNGNSSNALLVQAMAAFSPGSSSAIVGGSGASTQDTSSIATLAASSLGHA